MRQIMYYYRVYRGGAEVRTRELDEDEKARAKRVARMLRRMDTELLMREQAEHAPGYCPICHCLRTVEGKCTNGCEED